MSLGKIACNPHGDDLLKVLEPIMNRVNSDHWDVYVDQSQYERMVRGEKTGSLCTHSLLRPSVFAGFKSVLVASACMADTMFHRLFTAQGIGFEPAKGLARDLRYHTHEHGERITILYAAKEPWSKRYRDRKLDGQDATVLDQVKAAVDDLVGDEPFCWMGNTDLPDNFFAQSGAVRLPNTPHGLNIFQRLHNVAVLSALNAPPAHFGFMEGRGINGEEMRTAHYRTAVYQAVMRISIRNPDDATPKCVIVMDRDTAEWLADLFPGAKVEPLPGMGLVPRKGKAGRPRKHESNAVKTRESRDKKKRELLAQLDLINGTSLVTGRYPSFDQEVRDSMREFACNEIALKKRDIVTPKTAPQTCGTVFGSIYDRLPLDHVDHEDDDSFIAGLRALHQRVVAKEEAGVFSPAHFDPTKAGETARGLDKVTHLRGIWLDNDGGDLSHAEFAALFPYLRVVVWNTASSTAAKPRWRAFIPTTCAMSMDVHGLILAQIEKVLNRAGYWGRRQLEKRPKIKQRREHGFDESKFHAASLFYLPCQAKDQKDSFFVDCGEDDLKRGPLDLRAWIDDCILDLREKVEPEPKPATPVIPSVAAEPTRISASLQAVSAKLKAEQAQTLAGRREERVAAAVATWQETTGVSGTGHTEFFKLAAALKRAGLGDDEIRMKLTQQSAYARSPQERRTEIRGILKSLRQSGTFKGGAR